jgi:hypothetical protein
MGIKVTYTSTGSPGAGKRWYVWTEIKPRKWRKERLATYVRHLQEQGHHEQVSFVLSQAIRKGYRLRA